MKRDFELIRQILLTVEKCEEVPPKTLRIESFLDFCDNAAKISAHIEILKDAGFLVCRNYPRSDGVKGFEIERITFGGFEYLDSIRSAKIWRDVQAKILEFGGMSFDIIKEFAVNEIKKELQI